MTEPKPNYEYIGFNTYVCRTQAGFNRALKHFCRNYELDGSFQKIKNILNGYPKSYPSRVVFTLLYGLNTIDANCVPLEVAIQRTENFLNKLKTHSEKG